MDNIITERDSLVKTSSNLSDYAAIEKEKNEESEYLLKENNLQSNQSCFSIFINQNQGIITCIILGTLSVINITDRYVVGSVLIDIENYFDVRLKLYQERKNYLVSELEKEMIIEIGIVTAIILETVICNFKAF